MPAKGASPAKPKAKNKPGQDKEGPHVPELMTLEDWEDAVQKSRKKPVFIFKHSASCSTSARAAYRVNTWLADAPKSTPDFFFVNVRKRRPVSQAIEEALQVKHESPQLLLMCEGESVWDADRGAITAESIEDAMERYAGGGRG